MITTPRHTLAQPVEYEVKATRENSSGILGPVQFHFKQGVFELWDWITVDEAFALANEISRAALAASQARTLT